MGYKLKTVAVTKEQEEKMEVVGIKMLMFDMGVTRKDKIRNAYKGVQSTLIGTTVNILSTRVACYIAFLEQIIHRSCFSMNYDDTIIL